MTPTPGEADPRMHVFVGQSRTQVKRVIERFQAKAARTDTQFIYGTAGRAEHLKGIRSATLVLCPSYGCINGITQTLQHLVDTGCTLVDEWGKPHRVPAWRAEPRRVPLEPKAPYPGTCGCDTAPGNYCYTGKPCILAKLPPASSPEPKSAPSGNTPTCPKCGSEGAMSLTYDNVLYIRWACGAWAYLQSFMLHGVNALHGHAAMVTTPALAEPPPVKVDPDLIHYR